MSTKIYNAARVPLKDLNRFIDYVHTQGEKDARKIVMSAVSDMKFAPIPDWVGRAPNPIRALERWKVNETIDFISKNPTWFVNLEKWINVWIRGRYAYIMLCNLRRPRWAEDYSYWNNTDAPKRISQKAWDARGKVWGEICLGNLGPTSHNGRRLEHVITEAARLRTNFDLYCKLMGKDWLRGKA